MKPNLFRKWIATGLLGLALTGLAGLSGPAFGQDIAGTNQTALTDFELSTPWGYGYDYAWGWPDGVRFAWVGYAYVYNYGDTIKPEGTNVGAYFFTNAPMMDLMTNAGAGYGTGFGGPMSAGSYGFYDLSTNLSDYILSFDARVEGLSPGQTSGNCEMQAQWQASGNVYQLNFGVAVPSNWTHYSMLLSEYSGTGGTPGSLSNWVWLVENYMISGMTWNVNLHQPDPQFGFDDNNAVFVDNLTLQMIVRTGAPPVLPPTVALNILDWNMDDKPVWGGWGAYSWSQNAAYTPTFTWSPTANTYGVGGSNGWYLQMDNTVLAPPNTPSWAGGGCGDNGPTDYSRFNSGDLAGYRLTFDARAEGLNPNKMDETGGALQLFLDAPGGNYRADFRIPAGSNWVTTSYILNQGSFNTDGGRLPKTSFPTNYNITAVRIQVQIENATSEGDWSYDADNLLVVDNIKLERMQIACPPLTITTIGSNEVLTWAQPYAGVAKLQAANGITGSWADVAGATSPYTNSVANAPKYYRTIWVAPTP